ncbi:excinuclease ABC subunit UvrC [Candidatus Uhrbacteria bacterium]|nr:excinuclease ABC subunit UvrC [Candidatus Uhrbacteria bacterium]
MKNADGGVVYVGKAKHLRKRVASYWRARDYKTVALVAEIADIETIVTDTEEEALVLEAQLIQTHHPKYNIDLQTPGRYAYIKLTREAYPRFVIARKVTKDGTFFGPYPSAATRNQLLRSAHTLFQLCSTKRNQKRPCFRYSLGACAGACAGRVSKEEHARAIASALRFLRGEFSSLIRETEHLMKDAAKREQYEQAKIYRDRLLALRKREEQKLSQPKRYDQDIVNYVAIEGRGMPLSLGAPFVKSLQGHTSPHDRNVRCLTIQLFHFNRGIISGRKEFTFDLDVLAVEGAHEALRDFIVQYYTSHAIPSEIVIPEAIPDCELLERFFCKQSGHAVTLVVPQRGTKRKLLEMVKKNLLTKLGEGGGQLYELQRLLRLPDLPRIIDCIDISHLSGTETVGSLVQFMNGQPTKAGYRKFIIKNVKGNNDVASIHEVVTRFAKRIQEEKEKKPDLLLIDGGKGQLNSALRALSELHLEVSVAGLAKRLEEVYVPGSKDPLMIPPRSTALQLLRAVRDEAHRFAITFQRRRRRGQGISP